MAAKRTLTVESQRHQRALQTAARTFLNMMKSDDHSQEKYIDFLKDVKYLIQDHVSELKTCDVTEIMRTVLKMVCDPLCKVLCPNELSTYSSDDDLPGNIPNVEEDYAIGSFQTCSAIDDPPHHHNKRMMRLMCQTW